MELKRPFSPLGARCRVLPSVNAGDNVSERVCGGEFASRALLHNRMRNVLSVTLIPAAPKEVSASACVVQVCVLLVCACVLVCMYISVYACKCACVCVRVRVCVCVYV